MDENDLIKAGTEIVSEVGKEIVKQGYSDISPAVKESSKSFQLLSSYVNEVIFNKMQNSILKHKYERVAFERVLQKKYDAIPVENRVEPPLNIVGPTIDALKYTIDEEVLREMFLNLLTSSMDSKKQNDCHPSFSEIIKQLSPLDAKVLKYFSVAGQLSAPRVTFSKIGTGMHFADAMPELFIIELYTLADPFLISSSLANLIRLGLFEIRQLYVLKNFSNEKVKNHEYLIKQLDIYKDLANKEGVEVEVQVEGNTIYVTDFGKTFTKTCINKSEVL